MRNSFLAIAILITLIMPATAFVPVFIDESPEPAKVYEVYGNTVIFNSGGGRYYCVGFETSNCFTTVADAHAYVDYLIVQEKIERQQQAELKEQAKERAYEQIRANQIQLQQNGVNNRNIGFLIIVSAVVYFVLIGRKR